MPEQSDDAQNESGRTMPDDLYDYVHNPPSRIRRPRHAPSPNVLHIERLTVTDDWPDDVPVTEAEIDIFERYFGDALDRLFGPDGAEGKDLKSLSRNDNEKP